MIRRKGQVFRLETPNTTLAIKADTAEYLYYGKKLVSGGGFEPAGSGSHTYGKMVSGPGMWKTS